MNSNQTWLPLAIGSVLAVVFLYLALRANRRKRLVDNIPTSKTTGVFIGLVELKGTAETDAPLTSYLAEQSCVYYSWNVQEHWSRTVTETYTDSQGKTRTRTRHESGWTTVANGGEMTPFYLKDDQGGVLVRLEGAKIEPQTIFSKTCSLGDPLYYAKGPAHSVPNSDHRRLFTEQAIVLHAPLYVVGHACERADVVAPEIAADKDAELFLISTRSELQVSKRMRWESLGWHSLGMIVSGGASLFAFGHGDGATIGPVIGAGMYLLTAAAGWVWMAYNSMVDLKNRVSQAWSLVDVQLQRRHDLIRALVAVATGLRDYEREAQTELAALRSQLEATPPGQPGPDPSAIGTILTALAERYPQLQAMESFLRLQKELANTETRIALARGYFNEIATHYNNRLEIVPDRYVSRLAGLRPQALMAANNFERLPVAVQFAA
ncbi:MAG: LemA family protein [Verrucomicrobiia bacterium]